VASSAAAAMPNASARGFITLPPWLFFSQQWPGED